jgi:N-methylhydantoinase A
MTYGHASPDEAVQVVNLRVAAVGRLEGLELGRATAAAPARPPEPRPAYFRETGLVRCEVLARDGLAAGARGAGPVIFESSDTTVVVPPGWRWRADGGFLVLEAIA